MQSKINWIDNLRGIACLMVVMIHTTTWYVTNAHSISPVNWDVANILNSASRVSVPLFFMISGFLFFGERSAQPRHFIRIVSCLLFYSAISLLYIILFTSINAERSLLNLLQKPVFYHLWFFFAIMVIYLVSPLIQVKNVREAAIKWSAAPDMTPQTVLYRRPVAQFSNFQPKIVSSWLILALFQANFLISGRSRLCPYQLVNSNQVRQGE
ncbi:hypothetical protein OIPHN069_41680 [Enterobacter hormaechei subsp. hoffmannii]|nr:hypothetical protein OIPHN069_41680 [Enterobacter hormaechei subsp. hoffmannii]